MLRLCHREGVSVFPRGAGTGTTGASVPVDNGIVLCLSRMVAIHDISPVNLNMTVEPGVITGRIQKEAEHLGLFYPPDPASLAFCTIGGNIATGAGGSRAVKYGVTRDYVMALQVVTAAGDIINTGTATAKGVVGYDLTRLMVGSEGTLGVVTGITLRLVPKPPATGTVMAFFLDSAAAMECIVRIFENGILPRCAEFMDRSCIDILRPVSPVAVPDGAGAALLLESDGLGDTVRQELQVIAGAAKNAGATDIKTAGSAGEAESIWHLRRSLSPALRRLGFPDKISEDVCVPRAKLPEMLERLERTASDSGVRIVTFGHAGDGNLHVNILCDLTREREQVDQAVLSVMDHALALGGTISGEHGIGLTKSRFIERELSPQVLELMKSVKRAFDSRGILNPGKVFSS